MSRILVVMSALVVFCACTESRTESLDEQDWKRSKPLVTDFRDSDAYYVQNHLERFPECQHRDLAEWFFFTRCSKESSVGCKEYVKYFPKGEKLAEIEPLLWSYCDKTSLSRNNDSCELYIKTYPHGQHVAALLKSFQEQAAKRGAESTVKTGAATRRADTADFNDERLSENEVIHNRVKAYGELAPLTEAVTSVQSQMDAQADKFQRLLRGESQDRGGAQSQPHSGQRQDMPATQPENSPSGMAASLKQGLTSIAKDERGVRALFYAIENGYYFSAKALVEAGANLHATDPTGRTALEIAQERGNTRLVELLRKGGR